jgi:hypothetical protein
MNPQLWRADGGQGRYYDGCYGPGPDPAPAGRDGPPGRRE